MVQYLLLPLSPIPIMWNPYRLEHAFFNDSGIQLGFTPLQWESVAPVEQEFTVSLAGHAPVTAQPGNEVWNRHMFCISTLDSRRGSGYTWDYERSS